MNDVFKGVITKILTIVIIVAALFGGGYYLVKHVIFKPKVENETSINITEVLEERLEEVAELNTADYICTYVQEFKDQKKINDWKIPFTSKSFTISYEGTVKAGIKDLTKAQINSKDDKTVVVSLPKVEITGKEIDKDSLKIYDESHNVLNQISVEDVNEAQKNLEDEMVKRAEDYGLLDNAQKNAEKILASMLKGSAGDYTVEIQWQE